MLVVQAGPCGCELAATAAAEPVREGGVMPAEIACDSLEGQICIAGSALASRQPGKVNSGPGQQGLDNGHSIKCSPDYCLSPE